MVKRIMTGTKFDIKKFDGKNDFTLWQVRMKALLEQRGLAAALEELPGATIATYDNVIQKKSLQRIDLMFGLVCPSTKEEMLEPVKAKCIFLGYRKGTGSVQVLQGVEFDVEPQEDHRLEVEPHGNVDHVAVACEVISKWKAGLKDDMDARSDMVWFFLADARLRSGLPRVCWLKQREIYLVWRSSGIRVNGKWSCIYAVGSQEYQMVCTRLDIASADVEAMMLHMMALSPTEAGYMTLTKAVKEAIGLKKLAIESGFELKIVAGIATRSLSKAIPGLRF
ncbi:hypothetical protein Tco_0973259 [Tanacetum coccineum]